jgi:hypothetical protein
MSKHVRMVMFGHSYLRVKISRAVDAHSSPRRKFGVVLSFGWFEKRAAIAQTDRINTGGSVPALAKSGVSFIEGRRRIGIWTHFSFLMKLGLWRI